MIQESDIVHHLRLWVSWSDRDVELHMLGDWQTLETTSGAVDDEGVGESVPRRCEIEGFQLVRFRVSDI
jgi:hypothetical protein